MLSLPSKPWKKVKLEELEDGRFRLKFVSGLESEQQFDEVVDEDLVQSLGTEDRIEERDGPSRSLVLSIADLANFKRKLIFASIMIGVE
ncbi:MAG: hypothetical protein QGF09_01440 [Rhodospirillales bacterium]|jgi:hypothetical protein|nr:hypothetical protein [Rhodospirillales bacterium]